jgi:hypothetical protein
VALGILSSNHLVLDEDFPFSFEKPFSGACYLMSALNENMRKVHLLPSGKTEVRESKGHVYHFSSQLQPKARSQEA